VEHWDLDKRKCATFAQEFASTRKDSIFARCASSRLATK